jgi:hypothetical protein
VCAYSRGDVASEQQASSGEGVVFIQVMRVKVSDRATWAEAVEAWERDVRPHATGFLGATSGLTADGEFVVVARFESAAAARANSDLPAQTAWYEEASKGFAGAPVFHDCAEVDQLFGGGSDKAGFVQVMEGRAKDQQAVRDLMGQAEAELRRIRPDLLGATMAWHGDGGGFTQTVYFSSEAEARTNEAASSNPDEDDVDAAAKRFMELLDGPVAYYDLTSPNFQ